MKRVYIFFILIFTPILLFSQLKLVTNDVIMQQNCNLVSQGSKIILYGLYMTNQGFSYFPINLYNGTEWSQLPSYFESGNKIDTLEFRKDNSCIIFGKNNDIWVCGRSNGFYNWNGDKYKKYFLDDSLKSIREYTSIGMDSVGNIWLTTNVILAHDPPYINYYTELIKYDGQKFDIVADNREINKLGFSSIFISSTNTVFVTSTSINDNLLTIDNSGVINISTLPTPHNVYNPDKYEQRLVDVISIFEDNRNNIWFGLGESSPRDPGLVLLKNDNSWGVYTEHNNYPLRKTFNGGGFIDRDSVFSVCNAITEDKDGRIWVGGAGFLSYINEDNILVTPDIEGLLNKSTFYSSKYLNDPGKEIPPRYEQFLNSSDSISTIVTELFNRDWTTQHTMGKIGNVGGRVESMTTTEDGSLWIVFFNLGVLRYQPLLSNVDDVTISEEINLYPQPVISNDKLINIVFENSQFVSNINIYNMNGKLIQRNKYDRQINDKIEMRLDNNDFVAGTYFAAIELKDKTIFRKFIIN